MGSPDPDGRQIDGLGGGASSLSKTAIISPAGSMAALNARKNGSPLPAGLDWIDEDVQRTKQMCDIVYRFGQVPINGNTVDWSSTCGNMVAAVAHFSVQQGLISPEILADRLPPPRQSGDSGQRQSLPMSILSHDSAKVVIARVPVDLFHTDGNVFKWLPALDGEATIAGVPGRHPGILIESPLEGSVLSTGQPRDEVEVDGDQVHTPLFFTSSEASVNQG